MWLLLNPIVARAIGMFAAYSFASRLWLPLSDKKKPSVEFLRQGGQGFRFLTEVFNIFQL